MRKSAGGGSQRENRTMRKNAEDSTDIQKRVLPVQEKECGPCHKETISGIIVQVLPSAGGRLISGSQDPQGQDRLSRAGALYFRRQIPEEKNCSRNAGFF